ncbi:hypothetical protein [Phytoactinopolyspora mesophila]|uniref:YcaO domain-containing protein n=1 Tax=Phytoactinopolyspora mesophila TaxID=2650750 RepID=A0A7K3MB11_9ACTN|nr:hypothetical protein [Phytoactinopolyspora mesophila]NDL60162.1 hypothetical protein [Phytoactinopolyspora mesophila]
MTAQTTAPSVPTTTRPRVRQDVAFLETLDGVYVRSPDNAFVLRGAGAYRYLSALLPHLDGSTTLDDLVSGLPEGHGASVRSLLGTLAARGVIADGPDLRELYDAETRSRYASQLALLDHHGDDGTGFARAVNARVALVCDDHAAAGMLAEALTANGVGSGGDGFVRVVDTIDVKDCLVEGLDLVVLVAIDRPHPSLLTVGDTAHWHGADFVSVVRVGDQIVLGPHDDATTTAGVSSALLRMSDNGIAGTEAIWQAAGLGSEHSVPGPALPGNAAPIALSVAGFEIFKILTKVIPSDLTGSAVIVDPHRLTVSTEPVLPHPAVTGADTPRVLAGQPVGFEDVEELDDLGAVDVEEAYKRFERAVSATVGIMREFDDDAVAQIPVKVARLDSPSAATEPIVTFGSATVLETRLAALEEAAARYALAIQRRVQLLPAPVSGATKVRTEAVQTWLGAEPARPASVAAVDLTAGVPLAVERAAVLAGPWDADAAVFEPALTGLAAGPSPAHAAGRALVDAVAGIAVGAVARGELPLHPVGPDVFSQLEPEQRKHLRLLINEIELDGTKVDLFTGRSVLPVAAVRLRDGQDHAVARASTSWFTAIHDALLTIAGARQLAEASADPRYGHRSEPPAGPTSRQLTGIDLGAAMVGGPAIELPEPAAPTGILLALNEQGRRAALVDLTPPDLAGITSVARVLVYRHGPAHE